MIPVAWRGFIRRFFVFGIVGTVGFVVDTAVLYFALYGLGFGFYGGRVLSYLAGATSTWFLNRTFTFAERRTDRLLKEWATFLTVNALGGLVNYATYSALIATSPEVRDWPVLGVAAGSIAGMFVNYFMSSRFVFRGASSDRSV